VLQFLQPKKCAFSANTKILMSSLKGYHRTAIVTKKCNQHHYVVCDLQTLCSVLYCRRGFFGKRRCFCCFNQFCVTEINVQFCCICKEMSVIASTLKRRQKLMWLSAGHYTMWRPIQFYVICKKMSMLLWNRTLYIECCSQTFINAAFSVATPFMFLFSLVHFPTDYVVYFSLLFRCCMCIWHMLLKYY